MVKKLFTGISIFLLLTITLLGCQPVTKTEEEEPKPNTPVVENSTNSEPNKPGSQQESKPKRISTEEIEKIAFEAAKKAEKTVSGWKNAEIMTMDIKRIPGIDLPTDVFSLDDYNVQLDPKTDEVLMYLFQDINVVSSFLYLYVDTATGEVVGCYYTPEMKVNGSSFNYSDAKITAAKAVKIALEAGKKVIIWDKVPSEHRFTHLINDSPNYVYPLDNYPTEPLPFYEGQLDLGHSLKYEVWLKDTDNPFHFLLIYVDAITGGVLGCKYTSV